LQPDFIRALFNLAFEERFDHVVPAGIRNGGRPERTLACP
jgi:hypothetical protein